MQVRIKFIRHGANSVVGGFGPGDFARVEESFARHLIEVAKVAVLADAVPAKPAAAPKSKAVKE